LEKRGRPQTGQKPQSNFRLDARALEYAEKLIGKNGWKSRSAVLREAMWYGLQCLKIKTADCGERTKVEGLRELIWGEDS
jgi:hypothetical protein